MNEDSAPIKGFSKGSGQLFDLRLLSLFGIFSGFEEAVLNVAVAKTMVLLVSWDAEALLAMASGACGPALPSCEEIMITNTPVINHIIRFMPGWAGVAT